MGKYSYISGKLRETIFSLAVGPDDIRGRLIQAHKGFWHLREEHFPKELWPDWVWIINELKKVKPEIREKYSNNISTVELRCRSMHKKTGVKIAKKILEIYLKLNDET